MNNLKNNIKEPILKLQLINEHSNYTFSKEDIEMTFSRYGKV